MGKSKWMGETQAVARAPRDSDFLCQVTWAHYRNSLQVQLVYMEDPLLPAAQPRMTPALGISSSTKGLSPSGFHFLLVYLYQINYTK